MNEIYKDVVAQVKNGWLSEDKFNYFKFIYQELKRERPFEFDSFIAVESGVFYGMSAIAQGVLINALVIENAE